MSGNNFIREIEDGSIEKFTDFGDDDSVDGIVMPEACEASAEIYEIPETDEYVLENVSFEAGKPRPLIVDAQDKTLLQVSFVIKELMATDVIFGRDDLGLYVYDVVTGAYRLLNEKGNFKNTFQYFLVNILPEKISSYALKKNIVEGVYKKLLLDDSVTIDLDTIDCERYVCFKNGVYDLKNKMLLPHSPAYGCKFCINANYIEGKLSFVTKAFFEHLGKDAFGKKALFQMLGVALSNIRRLQLSGFLIGPAGSGKSEFLRLFETLLPDVSCTYLSLEDLGDRFGAGNLVGAHVSLCGDLEEGHMGKKALAKFKKIVGADKIMLQQKYVQHFSAKVTAFFIFAGNFLPEVDDRSGAFERRVWLINTGETIPAEGRNPHLTEMLRADIDAIASKAVRAAADIYAGAPINRAALETAYNGNTGVSQSIRQWCSDNLIECTGGYIRLDEIKKRLCEDGIEVDSLPVNAFGRLLRNILPKENFKKKENVSAVINYSFTDDNHYYSENVGGYW